jgi:hypothetical protein
MIGKPISGEGTALPEPTAKPSDESSNDANDTKRASDIEDALKYCRKYRSYDPSHSKSHIGLSALAIAQLRLDVEAASSQAGHTTKAPTDFGFFDALELWEHNLRDQMGSLDLAKDFNEMRKRAAVRFPRDEKTDPKTWEEFVAQHKAHGWLGIKGMFANVGLWMRAYQTLDCEGFERYADAVNLPRNSAAREMMQTIAQRYIRLKHEGGDTPYWAELAIISLLDDERFERFLRVTSGMGGLFADELVTALQKESLEARMRRKAERGLDDPSVVHQALPASKQED